MCGHKRVRERRNDALTRLGWELEVLLATWYRGQGYEVEHTRTAVSGTKYDGGIDLKLRRPGEYVLVQVKHWNAYKVPHNDVHQLLGLMVNEGATGAILITSGEFIKAAIKAAARYVRLIDSDELRSMLGPLLEFAPRRSTLRTQIATKASVGQASYQRRNLSYCSTLVSRRSVRQSKFLKISVGCSIPIISER